MVKKSIQIMLLVNRKLVYVILDQFLFITIFKIDLDLKHLNLVKSNPDPGKLFTRVLERLLNEDKVGETIDQ